MAAKKETKPKKSAAKAKIITAPPGSPGRSGHDDKLRAAARARWESDPQITLSAVALETKIGIATLNRWKKKDKWEKRVNQVSRVAPVIADINDKIEKNISNSGSPDTPENRQKAAIHVAESELVRKQNELLERHKQEWNGPRKVLYEALTNKADLKDGDVFNKLKIAKIATEALRNIQDGERKAYGIDKPLPGPDNEGDVFIIREPKKQGNTYSVEDES